MLALPLPALLFYYTLIRAHACARAHTSLMQFSFIALYRSLQRVRAKLTGDAHADTILHLVVRRGTNVGWHSHDDQFELVVANSETAEGVKRRIEATSGLAANAHMLLFKGQVLFPLLVSALCASFVFSLASAGHSLEVVVHRVVSWKTQAYQSLVSCCRSMPLAPVVLRSLFLIQRSAFVLATPATLRHLFV